MPLKKLEVLNSKIDIAILPYWILTEDSSKDQLLEMIAPQKIIATHINPKPNSNSQTKESIRINFPDASVFTNLEEDLIYEH